MNHSLLVQSTPAQTIAGGSLHPSQRRYGPALLSRALTAITVFVTSLRPRLLAAPKR